MVSAPLRGKSSRLHSQYTAMVATDAAAMTATTGDANAEVSDVATLEKMSAGVAAQNLQWLHYYFRYLPPCRGDYESRHRCQHYGRGNP